MANTKITSRVIADDAVLTANIADDAVTSAKLDTNIAIAGTLGVTGAVTADAGISIDNITIDGTEIDLSSGNLTLDSAGDIYLDADGADIVFLDGGTHMGTLKMANSNLNLDVQGVDKDIIFSGNDGGSAVTALTLDMSEGGDATFNGNVGIGTTPATNVRLDIRSNATTTLADFRNANSSGFGLYVAGGSNSSQYAFRAADKDNNALFSVMGDGNVGIGTSSPATGLSLVGANNAASTLTLTNTAPSPDNTWTFTPQYNSGDLTISDDGTEIMRVNTNGNLLIGRTTDSWNTDGIVLADSPFMYIERTDGSGVLYLHRRGTDGVFIQFWHANAYDGYISSSSGVVSLTGFQGSHSSSGDGISADTEIGTVVSTIDEEHSQRHAKIKVSDSVGDKRVYGTLEKWNPEIIEENGQTIEAHALVASTGVGSIRVTGACEGGDLLESNGDGTAKVQSDDIVRSKTIGKVTIGNSNTGVKLVSCVLYCG